MIKQHLSKKQKKYEILEVLVVQIYTIVEIHHEINSFDNFNSNIQTLYDE